MTTTFPGIFAGKMAFCSVVSGVANSYLTILAISDGKHHYTYVPGMNAPAVTEKEKFMLYLYPDGYYRIQSGDLRWLTYDTFIQCDENVENAAAFKIPGNPFGSQLSVKTKDGDTPLYYLYQNNLKAPNVIGVVSGPDHYETFAPTQTTPSLDTIKQQKKATGADFANVILVGQDLSQGIDFTSANFVGAQLAGVNFSSATLDKANMSKTDLRGLNWGNPASAANINLSGANAEKCVFGGQTKVLNCFQANLSSADLTGANLINLNLQEANLSGAILNGAFLDKSLFNNANLNGVVALKASFNGAKLIDASGQMGIFSRAVFDNADLTRVKMGARSYLFDISNGLVNQIVNQLDTSKFAQPELINVFKSNGITLTGTAVQILIKGQSWLILDDAGPYKLILTNAVLQVFNVNPNIIPAILREASLKGVTAPTASFAGADLRGVRWHAKPSTLNNADLQDAAFSGALLVSMNFTQANVSGVDFSDSILIQGNFTGCIAGPGGSQRAISFEGAHIEGVDFSKATFSGAILTSATVALSSGVPLLFLQPQDQQYLTTAGIGNLASTFRQAGFDLGSAPTVANNSFWTIDNSKCADKNAPKQYAVYKSASGFNVFGDGKFLFPLPSSIAPFLNQAQASQQLVNLFSGKQYNLALAAPITVQNIWAITVGSNAGFLRPYRFNTLQVQKETTRLSVYGTAPMLLENAPEYEQGVAFNATVNLLNALSPNAVGPAGVPFYWIAQELIDAEAFSIAL